jgi:hypothetical protein
MRIHRTTPRRAFSGFANALRPDRSASWRATGVLTYLPSFPNGARAALRSLAERCAEGRARTPAAPRELEESRSRRRVVPENRESGQLSMAYEAFDTPCDAGPPTGEAEKIGA